MAPSDTPPASPSITRNDPDVEEQEEEGLDANDAVEIIDLDEAMEGEDEDGDDDEDEEEGGVGEGEGPGLDDSMMAQAASEASLGGASSRLEVPPEDNSSATFSEHGKAVFCCDVSPKDANVVVTGGEDDRAFVWDLSTGEAIFKCDGFKDSVVQVGFSHDGGFVAAADMSGVLRAWKVASKELVWEFEVSDVTWLSWHDGTNVLFATTVDSELWMWKIPSGDSKIFAGHGERAETAKVLPDGRRAVVGYGDGTMRVFDLRSGEVTHNISGQHAHSAAVASLDVKRDNNLVASGGVDGVARLFNLQASKGIGAFVCGGGRGAERIAEGNGDGGEDEEEVSSKSTVESVLFSEQNVLVTGSLEGVVNVWDISTQVSRLALSVGSGVVKMAWRNGGSGELLVATLDGLVRLVDIRLGKVVADCSGHTEAILDFAQSKDGSTVVSTSDDGKSKAFNLTKILSGK